MPKFWDRFLTWLGFDFDEEAELSYEEATTPRVPQKGNVVAFPGARPVKLVVLHPVNFEQAQEIADHLKNKRPVVVNFEGTERDVAQRLFDFASGTSYALGGSVRKVGTQVFLFSPPNVEVTGEISSRVIDFNFLSRPENNYR